MSMTEGGGRGGRGEEQGLEAPGITAMRRIVAARRLRNAMPVVIAF